LLHGLHYNMTFQNKKNFENKIFLNEDTWQTIGLPVKKRFSKNEKMRIHPLGVRYGGIGVGQFSLKLFLYIYTIYVPYK